MHLFLYLRLIKLLGDFTDELTTSTPFSVSRTNFALNGVKKAVKDFSGLHVDVMYNATTRKMIINHNGRSKFQDVDSSIMIPSSITEQLPRSMEDLKIITISYKNDHFFVKKKNISGKGLASKLCLIVLFDI